MLEVGPLLLSVPKVIAFVTSFVVAALFGLLLVKTDTGRPFVPSPRRRPDLRSSESVWSMSTRSHSGSAACLAIAACLLMPTYLVNPRSGNAFAVAFTTVVLRRAGFDRWALAGGLIIGVGKPVGTASRGKPINRHLPSIFILVLLVKPTGLSGARA